VFKKGLTRQFSWRRKPDVERVGGGRRTEAQRRPLVTPCLDNLDLPYADDEIAADTPPTVKEVCNHVRVSSSRRAIWRSFRMSMRGRTGANGTTSNPPGLMGTRRTSQIYRGKTFSQHPELPPRWKERRGEPTHFRWDASIRIRKQLASDFSAKRRSVQSVR